LTLVPTATRLNDVDPPKTTFVTTSRTTGPAAFAAPASPLLLAAGGCVSGINLLGDGDLDAVRPVDAVDAADAEVDFDGAYLHREDISRLFLARCVRRAAHP